MINAIMNNAFKKEIMFCSLLSWYHCVISGGMQSESITFHLQQFTLFIKSSNLYAAKKDFYTNNIIILLTLIFHIEISYLLEIGCNHNILWKFQVDIFLYYNFQNQMCVKDHKFIHLQFCRADLHQYNEYHQGHNTIAWWNLLL